MEKTSQTAPLPQINIAQKSWWESVYSASCLIPHWVLLKEFAQIYYPETKIISINPVGLKGVFDEIYQ